MKISKIKSKLDKILGLSAKESDLEKNLAIINSLLEKLNHKKAKLIQRLNSETDVSNINKLEQKLKVIKLQIKKADAYRTTLSA